MKVLYKILAAFLIVAFTVSFSSCSKKGYAHKSKRHSSSTIDPVTQKNEPVRKKYIVPDKKKKILGTEKSKI
ncbi:MAG: hypothetical protein P8100_07395 [bacterium]|jgi:hypothetical protein